MHWVIWIFHLLQGLITAMSLIDRRQWSLNDTIFPLLSLYVHNSSLELGLLQIWASFGEVKGKKRRIWFEIVNWLGFGRWKRRYVQAILTTNGWWSAAVVTSLSRGCFWFFQFKISFYEITLIYWQDTKWNTNGRGRLWNYGHTFYLSVNTPNLRGGP